jgi:osmotically-inducible protein OsmY
MTVTTTSIRQDDDVRREVQDELEWDLQVGNSPIGLSVKDGVVTLTGEVNSYAAKMAAVAATHRVRGVRAVANEISVHIPSYAERTDADVAQAVINVLKWNTLVPADQIEVTVAQGLVTLKGTVEWAYQRVEAEEAVRRLAGVRAVANQLTITPRVQRNDIKQRLEQALVRSAEVEAKGLTVEVHNTTVTLKGSVHSFAEKQAVERAAWAASGVTAVDNRLVITAI